MQPDFDFADIPVEFLPFFEPEGPGVVKAAFPVEIIQSLEVAADEASATSYFLGSRGLSRH